MSLRCPRRRQEAEPTFADLEREEHASDTESVLLDAERTLAVVLGALSKLDREVKVDVDHVLESLRTGEGAILEDVVDQEADAEGLLRPRSENLDGSNRRVVARESTSTLLLPVREAVPVEPLLHDLGHSGLLVDLVVGHDERGQAVLHEEHDLVRVLLRDLVEDVDELVDVGLGLHDEAVLEAQTLRGLAHLEDALLVAVVDGDVARLGHRVSGLEHDRRLAVSGNAGDHRHGRAGHAVTRHEQVHFLHARGDVLLQLLRDIDIQNVRRRGQLDASVESIDLHVVLLS